jgi:uncharacterized protein (TIGR02421 family)
MYQEYQPEQYINPVNLAEEKEKFFRNQSYNPQFRYRMIDKSISGKIDLLKKLKSDFQKHQELLGGYYVLLIDEFIAALEQFGRDRNTPEFVRWLISLYQEPNATLVTRAKTILHGIERVDKEPSYYNANEVAKIFKDELDKRGFKEWRIIVEDMPARVSINQYSMFVRIQASAAFSKSEVARLIVHEIDTHILRAENAKKQLFLLFRYGFPRYLMSEEGLAIYAEEQSRLLTPYDMRKYALRVLAAWYGVQYSFVKVYELLREYLDAQAAFDMTVRIKRGMQDTSLAGAFSKDQVYLAGYLRMNRASDEDIRKLFFGKIGLDDIETIGKIDNLHTDIVLPHWFGK